MKYWIDCGAHQGQGFMMFTTFCPKAHEFQLIGFEPNPQFNKFYEKSSPYEILHDVHLHNCAVWTKDGEMPLYLSDVLGQLGSTLVKGKTTGRVNYKRGLIVKTLDLSKWLKEAVTTKDTVFLKMNIEGSEYNVLNKMMLDGSIKLVDELYLALHGGKIKGRSKEDDQRLIKRIRSYGVEVIPWAIKGDGFRNMLRHWLCGSVKTSTSE